MSGNNTYLKMDDCNVIVDVDGLYIVYDYTKKLKLPKHRIDTEKEKFIYCYKNMQIDLLLDIDNLPQFKKDFLGVLRHAKKNGKYCVLKTSTENKTITITTIGASASYNCNEITEDVNLVLKADKNIALFNYLIGNELKIRFRKLTRGIELHFITDGRMCVESLRYNED